MYISQTAIIDVIPQINVPSVCSLYPVFILIFDIWVITQKKLSLTCDTTIAPEQSADTANAFSSGVSNPRTPIRGATIEAVVIVESISRSNFLGLNME
ncbi:MAG TPA: hypothetical protein VFC94_03575 [Bacteroidaceae bacterium]|nr:hypothetical protein [Bacteroidaceae bacterium]